MLPFDVSPHPPISFKWQVLCTHKEQKYLHGKTLKQTNMAQVSLQAEFTLN